eukprot:1351554-Amorphochlora_amoeboformis.AAC.2
MAPGIKAAMLSRGEEKCDNDASGGKSGENTKKKRKSARQSDRRDLRKYVNKQRTLVFASRGITYRDRHFMADLRDLLPHRCIIFRIPYLCFVAWSSLTARAGNWRDREGP